MLNLNKDTNIKNSPNRGLRSFPDLDIDLESHIIVNVSSILTNSTIWFVAALSLIVDVRTYVQDVHTYGRMDVRTDISTRR